MKYCEQRTVMEWQFASEHKRDDPWRDVRFHAIVTDPDGKEMQIPGFWKGGDTWAFRYASATVGEHRYRTVCSDKADASLHGREGKFAITPYEGDNPLYRHGAARAASNRRHLEHEDGTPFFWLGDTWWMSLTDRLTWPDDFQWLIRDRREKGFSVIQVVAGLYPDMAPFDSRGANEGGIAWEAGFSRLNPAFFDAADRKIAAMADAGLMPCLVGCWGYYLAFAGAEVIRRHWEYLIARYGAYPVAWCVAGEALMPYYLTETFGDRTKWKAYEDEMRPVWSSIAAYVKERDPFGRLVTIHPVEYGRHCVEDASMLDLEMLQTGHGGFLSLERSVRMVAESCAKEPRLPVINSEVNYEGIGASSQADVQRYTAWSCVLNGACGHTYGANGLWQVNPEDRPYGASPTGIAWGHTTWREAAELPGSAQVGRIRRILSELEWWDMEPHPEWLEPAAEQVDFLNKAYMAGVPGRFRLAFLPNGKAFSGVELRELERGTVYRATLIDPVTGARTDWGQAEADENGNWSTGRLPVFQDWVLLLRRIET
ncbi:DUF4038 domain-containing protein [Paenibacillus sp.]|uniref:apiosidase-like domain-containing protein n=1 Tax=Paenibacillus sp. TaxID=58172 RepID=UPI002D693C32|nr:DUF4038 domain-containing protein [Paenibacillus sp.]HZG56950.1 DUF4038 domain-containing protein [Paenibacillus sp.]